MTWGFWNSRVSRFRSLPLEVRNCGLIGICLLTGDPNGVGGNPNKPIDPNGGGNMVDCVEFEELNLADVYGVGDVFSVANSDGSLKFDAKVGGFGISGAGSAYR